MSIYVKETTYVRPAEATCRKSVWLTSLDLTMRKPYTHTPLVFIYRPNVINSDSISSPSNFFDPTTLKAALSKVLVHFYPLAGRLKTNEKDGRIEIDCNGEGVSFVEAETRYRLSDFKEFTPNAELRKVAVSTCDYSGGLSSFPLVLVQLTRFKCGGISLGFGLHHYAGDATTFAHLINSWSKLVRGLELGVPPFVDRTGHLVPRQPPQVNFDHLEYDPPSPPMEFAGKSKGTRVCLFQLSKGQINFLKLKATSQELSYKPNTYEVVAGHTWRCVCKARGLKDDQDVKIYIPMNGRSILKNPAIPQGYIGNVIFLGVCTSTAGAIAHNPLWYTARKIHEAMKRIDDSYLRSAIDYVSLQPDPTMLALRAENIQCPNLSINYWGRIPFYDAEFGYGRPAFVRHGGVGYEGQTVIMPGPNQDDGLSVAINLYTDHMVLLEKYMYDLSDIRSPL